MLHELTPSQWVRKMEKVVVAVQTQDKFAIAARTKVTKDIVIKTAQATSGLGRRYGKRWVKDRPLSKDSTELKLKGGFAFLAERGSWRASVSGWNEEPKNGGQALVTPLGFFAHVDHPPLVAHPFWHEGLEAARKPGKAAWDKVMSNSIRDAVR